MKTTTYSLVRQDLQRYYALESRRGKPGALEKVRIILATPGLHAILVYRFGSWVRNNLHFPLFRFPFRLLHMILERLGIILWGIHIHAKAEIGGGLYVSHYGGIIIGPVKMGKDCNVAHGVTIGRRAGGDPGVPTIGDRVWIGSGSILFGGITIGEGATIGPLTVVGRNLPPRVLVMGNPMRLLRKNYNNSAEIYGPNE